MIYYHHPQFINELDEFLTKHTSTKYTATKIMEDVQRVMTKHFENCRMYTNHQINLANNFKGYEVYFFKELVIPDSGLRRSQYPKCYLLKVDGKIGFLCMGTHVDNYSDNKLRKIALDRAKELFEILNKI